MGADSFAPMALTAVPGTEFSGSPGPARVTSAGQAPYSESLLDYKSLAIYTKEIGLEQPVTIKGAILQPPKYTENGFNEASPPISARLLIA